MYQELCPPLGLSHLACGWIADDAGASVLPDGCVDVVLYAGQLVVAGPATTAVEVPAAPGQQGCGVRFRVGAAAASLGVPVDVLCDVTVPLQELWGAEGRRLSEAAAAAPDVKASLRVLLRGFADPLVPLDLVARRAAVLATDQPFHAISRDLGFSERQLRRRVEQAVGYGPRMLGRIVRLQRFLQGCERDRGASLARLATEAGFADQAHLTRECRQLTGRTPSMLRAAGAAAAGERMSDAFKTDAPGTAILVP